MISEQYREKLQKLSGILCEGILHEEDRLSFLKNFYYGELNKKYHNLKPKQKENTVKSEFVHFEELIEADPTPNKKFSKWIITLYLKNEMPLEDLYKATEYLILFEKVKQKLPVEQRDINKYRNLPDLYNSIAPYEKEEIVSNSELQRQKKLEGADKILDNDKWYIITPKTREAACLYGKETKWCTASSERNMFDHYNNNGPMYILINKNIQNSALKNPMKKLQFHFQSNQFMDAIDNAIDIEEFLKQNPDILSLFKNIGEITPAFELEYKLLPKDKAIFVLEDKEERKKLINRFGVNWVFKYYKELGAKNALDNLISKDDDFLIFIIKNNKLDILLEEVKSLGGTSNDKLAKLLYSSPKIREFLQSDKSKEKDLEIYFEVLFNLGKKGEEYARELGIKTDFLYNIFKNKGILSSYYNLIPNSSFFNIEGAKNSLKRLKTKKYKDEFIAQVGLKIYEVMKNFITNIIEADLG